MRRAGEKSTIGGLLALSMILAGTSYAYWTDILNITTKATTSDFGITFVDLGLYAQYGNEMTPNGWSTVGDTDDKAYVNDTSFTGATTDYNKITHDYDIDAYKERQKGYSSIEFNAEFEKPGAVAKNVGPYNTVNTKDNRQINITINQMYSGYTQAFRMGILNVGSIAAKFGSPKFNVRGLEDSGRAADIPGIVLYMDGEQYHLTINEDKPVFKLVDSLAEEGDYSTVGGMDFIRLSALKKLSDEEIHKIVTNATILCSPATDNRIDLFLVAVVDPDAKGVYTAGSTITLAKSDGKASQKKVVEVNTDFLWGQLNIGKNAGNPNYLVKQNKSEKR